MAIAFDAVAGNHTGGASSLSWSHTVTTGQSNLILVIVVEAGASVTSVTYAGAGLTQVPGASVGNLSIWFILNPATGPNTAQVNMSASSFCNGVSASYFNAAQSATFGTAATNSGTGASSTNTVVTTNSNQVVINAIDNGGPATDTPTAGQTKRLQPASGGTAEGDIAATGANMVITWSFGGSQSWTQIDVAMNAAPVVGGPPLMQVIPSQGIGYVTGALF